jgi:hypothetical protein
LLKIGDDYLCQSLEESDTVLEQVIVEVLVQVQQHVQIAIVESQLIIDQFDLQIAVLRAVLSQEQNFFGTKF